MNILQIHEILQFLCTNKKKGEKKRLIRDKMEIKNVEMRIIKWEKVWINYNRERERLCVCVCVFAITASQAAKESKLVAIAKPKIG